MPYRNVVIAVAGALLSIAAPIAAADDFKISGTVATGYEVDDEPEPEAEAEVRLKTPRLLGTRGVFKIEGRYFKSDVFVEDAYIDHEVSPRLRLQLGVNKKRLGLEYQQGRRERLTPKRSLIYQRLEALAIVGRQLNARVLTEPGDGVSLDLTAGTTGNHDVNALVYLARERRGLGVGYWGLAERRRIDHGYLTIWAGALSGWYITGRYRAVLEFLSGVDPVETDLERLLGSGRRVHFAGTKSELAVRVPIGYGAAIEPLLQTSLMIRDTAEPGFNAVQVLGGLNLRRGRAILAVTAQYVSSAERSPPHRRLLEGPDLHVQARLHF